MSPLRRRGAPHSPRGREPQVIEQSPISTLETEYSYPGKEGKGAVPRDRGQSVSHGFPLRGCSTISVLTTSGPPSSAKYVIVPYVVAEVYCQRRT
ncbi:hypothetical protein BHE74_00031942 [Ensete ventricosum]|nr:hypothetical protein GW17_00057114 [Ensete ventricosum]RWW61016.1 hypothetical protein BHE74_00031942 [Ensete ventricosum]